MRRGEVWWVDLPPGPGRARPTRRRAIVVSHDALNEVPGWRSITVVPITTSERTAASGLTVVPLAAGENGIHEASVALCHQVTTLDRRAFVDRCGILSAATARAVADGLAVALDLGA